MTIKIVTDSTADLPPQLAKELGITVVPVYLRFGEEVFRDVIDISQDEFYDRLMHGSVHPSTSAPAPQDFIDVYKELSKEADGILSIHVTSKLSGTYNSALRARESVENECCPIEIIDSQEVTMGLGLIVLAANKLAQAGKSLEYIANEVRQMTPRIHLLGFLDTLKYLALGGRIGKMQALLGSVLNIKPMITIKDGLLTPAGRARSRAKGINNLFNFVKNSPEIQDISVVYNTTLEEAQDLIDRMSKIYNDQKIKLARLGPALGVHTGPGMLIVALLGRK
ncbi:MAG: DegV family protein [Dehalococcoidales bacterium]|nr:DegV family protein [Dehalococcoidales bacterium]